MCPRRCGANRYRAAGACGEGAEVRVAKVMLHRWEEPCISGSDGHRGSGAVFFSGCPLRCVFCQNRDISRGGAGETVSPERLAEIFEKLEAAGAYNINLVSPTQFACQITKALDLFRPTVPVVFNTGGYERVEAIRALKGYADIYLTDFKYGTNSVGAKYSACPDYTDAALPALRAMVETVGTPVFSGGGMLRSGVIVRHLVLPGQRHDSLKVLEKIADAVGTKNIILSLMSQYTPDFAPPDMPEIRRRVTTFEYESVRNAALEMGFEGYSQDASSSDCRYTPDFSRAAGGREHSDIENGRIS